MKKNITIVLSALILTFMFAGVALADNPTTGLTPAQVASGKRAAYSAPKPAPRRSFLGDVWSAVTHTATYRITRNTVNAAVQLPGKAWRVVGTSINDAGYYIYNSANGSVRYVARRVSYHALQSTGQLPKTAPSAATKQAKATATTATFTYTDLFKQYSAALKSNDKKKISDLKAKVAKAKSDKDTADRGYRDAQVQDSIHNSSASSGSAAKKTAVPSTSLLVPKTNSAQTHPLYY